MAQLYSIVTPNLTGTKLSLDSLYELALKLTHNQTLDFLSNTNNLPASLMNSLYKWGHLSIVDYQFFLTEAVQSS